MQSSRFTAAALVLMLIATGARTRPVEFVQDRFERQKPPIAAAFASTS